MRCEMGIKDGGDTRETELKYMEGRWGIFHLYSDTPDTEHTGHTLYTTTHWNENTLEHTLEHHAL
jgi:hypothetical protein